MTRHRYTIKGAELRAHRKAAKLTQAELARRAGFARDAVCYWEGKLRVPLRFGAPAAFARVLGLPENAGFLDNYARARVWGITIDGNAREQGLVFPDPWQAWEDRQLAAEFARLQARAAQRLSRLRVLCGAKTRAGGQCRNKSEPGKRRCKFHGGKSTGAKTPEGKARIAEAQRTRWAAYREAQRGETPPADHKHP